MKRPAKVNSERRRHLISTVTRVLSEGRPTYFRYEAACRQGLRVRFIIAGEDWQLADSVAADIVAAALRAIGARRPSWEQGQPRYTEDGFAAILRTRCRRCGGRIIDPGENHWGWARLYCSAICQKASRERDDHRTLVETHEAFRAAGLAKRMRRLQKCDYPPCRNEFIPRNQNGLRFCSNRCSRRHYLDQHPEKVIPVRRCDHCFKPFKPQKRTARACSQTCAGFLREAARRQVYECVAAE